MASEHCGMENMVIGKMVKKEFDIDFYKNKKVFITGHTGFKGTWLCKILLNKGAVVKGYSLEAPSTIPSLFSLLKIDQEIISDIGDIRDYDSLKHSMDKFQPEIVIHMAAQPLVRESYQNPMYTYETNIMGTVNILECIRTSNYVKSFLNVTTDKVYENKEWEWGYRESDVLNGFDPYSNSKSCSELVTHSYKKSFFDNKIPISTARAGNVIGGGDFAKNRIIPDCIRAIMDGKDIIVRNPYSTRPYQHVLEALYVYLMIVAVQYNDRKYQGYYNVGPDDRDCFQTGKLVDLFVNKWDHHIKWINQCDTGPHEADFLKLDCSKLKSTFNWQPKWNLETAIEKVVEWTKCWLGGEDISSCMDKQIQEFLEIDQRKK